MTDEPPPLDCRFGDHPKGSSPRWSGDGDGDGGTPDTLLFTRIVAHAAGDPDRALTTALGLDGAAVEMLIARFLPHRGELLRGLATGAGRGEDAVEEADVRAYLSEFRARRDDVAEGWLVAILARRMREANHLWQDLGLSSRHELNVLLRRHFPDLVRRNSGDMKWKKFIYRELCQRDGIFVCKSPNCAVCSDFGLCFGGEPGEPLRQAASIGDAPIGAGDRDPNGTNER